jgi:hypothetical protein
MLTTRRLVLITFAATILFGLGPGAVGAADQSQLAQGFQNPPPAARPWVYWFWLNGNITREGITADLEAMARVGIGGVLIMEVDQGAPEGPAGFATPPWRELFKHVCSEAARLGLQVNMNNDAGWCGSGGPWIKPEQSMQKVVWSETLVEGPGRFEGALPQPKVVADYYRDIAVLAFPVPAAEAAGGPPLRVEDVEGKAAFAMRPIAPRSVWPASPAEAVIPREQIADLSGRCGPDGKLAWDVPAGKWLVMRFGHTTTGAVNAPSPAVGRGLECDKLSKEGIEANFAGLMARLVADVGPLAGQTLVATHIDSWEVGSQNWTPRMRAEFRRLRGYDLLPFLPVMSGRVVDSLEVSERFLWDLRQTISDLLVENYAGHMRRLAHQHGLRLSIEAYGEPADDMAYAGRADEPMCEFWSYAPYGAADTCTVMASAAHVYGKPILGAEAFTADSNEKWLEHPGSIKAMGDWAFCEGINRFVFHRYALQPWKDRRPGMSMGPWGLHYERTQTWWEQSKPWHEYLARCQYLLQQGQFVADICYLAPEGSPQHFVPPTAMTPGNPPLRSGYNFDACPPEVLLTRSRVEDGRLVLSDSMRYRLLVLPPTSTTTPVLLRRVDELAEAGLTVLGDRPVKSPSLTGYPQCDAEVAMLAGELWDACDGKAATEHPVGKGKIVCGKPAEQVLADMGVPPDFEAQALGGAAELRFIHRTLEGNEVYFVANGSSRSTAALCTFRVQGRRPELWQAETGHIEPAPQYEECAGRTRVPLWLGPAESIFVVFRAKAASGDHAVAFTRDGQPVLPPIPPLAKIIVQDATYGVPGDAARTRDVTAAVQHLADLGAHAFQVSALARDGDPAYGVVKTLHIEYTVDGQPRVATATDPQTVRLQTTRHEVAVREATYGVPGDPLRTRDVTAKVQTLADEGTYDFRVSRMAEGDDPAYLVVKTLRVEYTLDGVDHMASATDPETIDLIVPPPLPAALSATADGRLRIEAYQPGRYGVRWSSGRTREVEISSIAQPLDIAGPWDLSFAPGWGAPDRLTLPELKSWSRHDDPGIRYYSGAATYRKTFGVPPEMLGQNKRLYLDLGRVAVIAEVKLNGTDLGTLWKPPYRVDVTAAIQPGDNTLEIRVINLWPNRMIGDEQLPEDSERNPDGTLQRWPSWLQDDQPSPAGRYTFTSWRLWKKDAPLLESGLLGPVRLEAAAIEESE